MAKKKTTKTSKEKTASSLSEVFDLKNIPSILWGTPKMAFYFVRLKNLNVKE